MTAALPKLHITLEGTEYTFDPNNFMFSEVVLLEDHCGISSTDLNSQIFSGTPPLRAIGAIVWLVQLRARAADAGIAIAKAAADSPFAEFDFNLGGITVRAVEEPENPTGPAKRTPATRTTRATSKKPHAKTSTASKGSAT